MRIAGVFLAVVGVALLVFYGFSFSFSASGSEFNGASPWIAQAGYTLSSRIGLAGGAVLIAIGAFLEREGRAAQ